LEWLGLEIARNVEVSRGEGLQVSCSKNCPRRNYYFIARPTDLMFTSFEVVAVVDISRHWMELDSESDGKQLS
jgi:hypothetical protein